MNLYQDVTEIVDADAAMAVDVLLIQVVVSVAATAAYGLSFFSSSAEDAAAILSAVTDAAATTAVSGLSFFSSSAEDAAVMLSAATDAEITVADATIAAANIFNIFNKRIYYIIKASAHREVLWADVIFIILRHIIFSFLTSYIFTTIQKECLWNVNLQSS